MIKDLGDQRSIPIARHALVAVKEVVVVVVEPQRQAFQDRRGQIGGRGAPLLFRIALEEGGVEVGADEGEGLILEGLGIGDIAGLRRDEIAGFIRAHGSAKELVDRVQVHGQGIDLTCDGGFDLVLIRHEGRETLHIIPDTIIVSVKDMRPVGVDHDAGIRIAGGVAISRHMGPGVHNGDIIACLRALPRQNGPGQPCAYHHQPSLHGAYPSCGVAGAGMNGPFTLGAA